MILTLAGKVKLKNTYVQYNIMSFTGCLRKGTKFLRNG